jgi:hypothetical protein
MPFLDQTTILALHAAALSADLSRSRDALLVGIDARFIASLALASSPGTQLFLDLGALNAAGSLTDGTVPLHIWLTNAAHFAGRRREGAVFARARDQVMSNAPAPESPSATAPRTDTLSRDQLPEALGNLLPAQLDLLIFKLGVPLAMLSGSMAPAAIRSIELIRWAEQANRLGEVQQLLAELTGQGKSAR